MFFINFSGNEMISESLLMEFSVSLVLYVCF